MTEAELPAQLIRFLRSTVPTYEAAVMLIVISREPARHWSAEDIVAQVPAIATPEAARQYVDHFAAAGVLRKLEDGTFQYQPASGDVEGAVSALTSAYAQRPVTLIRVIYSIATDKIQSFADAFRLKKD
jgi:hypothetical protein